MSQEKLSQRHDPEDRGYTPASPVKRTLAWIGLAYVLILLALTTYYYFTGTMLANLAPLLTVPGLLSLAAPSIVSSPPTGRPGKAPATALALFCLARALATRPR